MRTKPPGSKKADGWIPIKERLPEKEADVPILLFNPYGGMSEVHYIVSTAMELFFIQHQLKDKDFRRRLKKAGKDVPNTKILSHWASHWRYIYPPEK